jgi:hypothetical protein
MLVLRYLLWVLARIVLWLRYRIRVQGANRCATSKGRR